MEFWVLWFIGIGITIVTRIAINVLCKVNDDRSVSNDICNKSIPTQIIMHILAILCIVLVGGIAVAKFLGMFYDMPIWGFILLAIIPAMLTYVVEYLILGLEHFGSGFSKMLFVIVFIISIIGWTIPICNYNRNIEATTETTTVTQERQLLYFCNIPVQEISGKISGSSFLGTGNISGSISTSNELSYWYANENNEGIYGSAAANSSKIVFINDEETPRLEIISYCTYTKTINHNNGVENTTTDKEWKEYIFYLPEAIMQYPLE